MDEKTYQALLSGEQKYLDISNLNEAGKAMVWDYYEFLLQKQRKKQKQQKK